MSRFGVCSHMLQDEGLQLMADAGIVWQRVDVDWDQIQPTPDVRDWTQQDRIATTAEKLGLSLLGVLAYTPSWANGGAPDHSYPPKDPRAFQDFVSDAVSRFKGRFKAWSIWNEPNLKQFWHGTKQQFLKDVWYPGLQTIKNNDPGALIVGPDLSGNKKDINMWMMEALDMGKGLIDIATHHQYDGGDKPQGRIDEIDYLHRVMYEHGYVMPLWITEIGWDRVNQQQQALYLRTIMAAMMQRGAWWEKTFWYDSHGMTSPEYIWGLLDPTTLVPREAYHSYKEFIKTVTTQES